MKRKLGFFRIILLLAAFGLSTIVMSATPMKGGVTKDATTGQSVVTNPLTSSAVVDETKCPKKKSDGSAGSFVGGKCIYPMPENGTCKDLGDDCGPTLDNPPKCRCDAKEISGGGLGNPGQILSK